MTAGPALGARGGDRGYVSLAFTDVNGTLRGKAFRASAFDSICSRGYAMFTDLLLAVDPVDAPITTLTGIGMAEGAGDLRISPIDGALWDLPWNDGSRLSLGELSWRDGSPCELSPRRVLMDAERRLTALGFSTLAAFEYEVRLRALSDGAPATGGRSYSIHGVEQLGRFADEIAHACGELDLGLSAIHTEAGPGLVEINLDARPALDAADVAVLVRHAVAAVAGRCGLQASFLAKPVAGEEGSSGHVHLSLWRGDENAMAGQSEHELSPILLRAVAGLLEHLPAASLCLNPTLNSYKRLVPGFFAPVNRSWGVENRSAAVRAIVEGGMQMARVEVRRPGVDANPYLALAAILASVSLGIEQESEPPPGSSGDISEAGDLEPLPASLESALAAFRADASFRAALGTVFSDYYALTREWELRAWQETVTPWELNRYGAL